jgi:hypothetical protein
MKLVLKNTNLVFASVNERVMADGSRSKYASAGCFIPSAPLKVGTTLKSIKIVPGSTSITVAVIKFNSQPVDGSPYELLMDEQTISGLTANQINTVDISTLNIHVDSSFTYLVVSNLRYSPDGDEIFFLRGNETAIYQSGCNNLCLGWTW